MAPPAVMAEVIMLVCAIKPLCAWNLQVQPMFLSLSIICCLLCQAFPRPA